MTGLTPAEEAEARAVEKGLDREATPRVRGRISGLVFVRSDQLYVYPPHCWPPTHHPVPTGESREWFVFLRKR